MLETIWLKLSEPYEAHGVGDVISVSDMENVDYLVTNGIAEIVDAEIEHHIEEDQDYSKYGVEQNEEVWVFSEVPIHLGTNVAKWKLNNNEVKVIESEYDGRRIGAET